MKKILFKLIWIMLFICALTAIAMIALQSFEAECIIYGG